MAKLQGFDRNREVFVLYAPPSAGWARSCPSLIPPFLNFKRFSSCVPKPCSIVNSRHLNIRARPSFIASRPTNTPNGQGQGFGAPQNPAGHPKSCAWHRPDTSYPSLPPLLPYGHGGSAASLPPGSSDPSGDPNPGLKGEIRAHTGSFGDIPKYPMGCVSSGC